MSTKDNVVTLEKRHLPLTLTGEEVYYLTDAVPTFGVQASLDRLEDRYLPLAKEALLLLGDLYLELVDGRPKDETGTIMVSEDMVWLFRGLVKSEQLDSAQVKNIGVALLRKLYTLLLKFYNDLDDLPTADVEDAAWTPEQVRLALAKENPDALDRTRPDAGPDPNDYAS